MLDAIIDISHYNGASLDFAAAAASGTVAVIHKATQGASGKDPLFATNRPAIAAAGLRFGAYHFGDGSDGGTQANFFLAVVAPQPGDLLALDFEPNTGGPSMTLEEARAFVTAINHVTGVWPVLYGGHYLKETLTSGGDKILSNCPLWLAQFGPAAVIPPGWATWSMWQYSDGTIPTPTSVPGIGHCDRDRFNGDLTSLAAFWTRVSPS